MESPATVLQAQEACRQVGLWWLLQRHAVGLGGMEWQVVLWPLAAMHAAAQQRQRMRDSRWAVAFWPAAAVTSASSKNIDSAANIMPQGGGASFEALDGRSTAGWQGRRRSGRGAAVPRAAGVADPGAEITAYPPDRFQLLSAELS